MSMQPPDNDDGIFLSLLKFFVYTIIGAAVLVLLLSTGIITLFSGR